MRHPSIAVVLALSFFLQSCAREPDRLVELRVLSDDPEVVALTDSLLLSRFQMLDSSFLSDVNSKVDGSNITYTFRNGGPDNSTIEFFYKNAGLITMSLADDPSATPLITSDDVARLESRKTESGEVLFFELSPSAGERMLVASLDNLGKVMVLKVDEMVLMEATIRGAFARQFQVSAGKTENIGRLYAVMVFGPLPARVELRSPLDGP